MCCKYVLLKVIKTYLSHKVNHSRGSTFVGLRNNIRHKHIRLFKPDNVWYNQPLSKSVPVQWEKSKSKCTLFYKSQHMYNSALRKRCRTQRKRKWYESFEISTVNWLRSYTKQSTDGCIMGKHVKRYLK